MIVMPSNNSGIRVGWLAGKYPGRLGWLMGINGYRTPPDFMPAALDNGAYPAWVKNEQWDECAWWAMLEVATSEFRPIWAVVPDVVTDAAGTLGKWEHWAPIMRDRFPHLPLALAVQDGMEPDDPKNADYIFVGGSTEWKWRNLRVWTDAFPGVVHVGRVNTERLLWMAHRAGAVSCDGTGWFRGDRSQLEGLHRYLKHSTTQHGHPQMILEGVEQ